MPSKKQTVIALASEEIHATMSSPSRYMDFLDTAAQNYKYNYREQELSDLLADAVAGIHGQITEYDVQDVSDDEEDHSIPADPTVRNFSFALVDGKVYFRENSRMNPVELTVTAEGRVKGMIAIRDCVRQLIEYQTEDYPDSMIEAEQENHS